jgi:hypothetical protein
MQKLWMVKVQVKSGKSQIQRVKVTPVTTARVTCCMTVQSSSDDVATPWRAMWHTVHPTDEVNCQSIRYNGHAEPRK